jgi:hypothetical protein
LVPVATKAYLDQRTQEVEITPFLQQLHLLAVAVVRLLAAYQMDQREVLAEVLVTQERWEAEHLGKAMLAVQELCRGQLTMVAVVVAGLAR